MGGGSSSRPEGAIQLIPSARVFIQARMSSRRFPGKVLAPLHSQPLIQRVITAVQSAAPTLPLVVATSREASDDPLVAYVEKLGLPVFRGDLENVFVRFLSCAASYPCDWILRICADSPFVNPQVIRTVIDCAYDSACDLVTTRFPCTFPKGHNAELIRVATMHSLDLSQMLPEDCEHVTPYFYRQPEQFRIINVETDDSECKKHNLAVDEVEDLIRLEASWGTPLHRLTYSRLATRLVSVGKDK